MKIENKTPANDSKLFFVFGKTRDKNNKDKNNKNNNIFFGLFCFKSEQKNFVFLKKKYLIDIFCFIIFLKEGTFFYFYYCFV